MKEFGFPCKGFDLIGLAHKSRDGKQRDVHLAEAGIDPRSGGAVVVTTDAKLDGKDGLTTIDTNYWRMSSLGKWIPQKLFEISFKQELDDEQTTDGRRVKGLTLVPTKVCVLGHNKVYEEGDNKAGKLSNIAQVLNAVAEINREMRAGRLPNVAQILKDCKAPQVSGDNLVIVGMSPTGGFDFDPADVRADTVNEPLTVPTALVPALSGLYDNTLDDDRWLEKISENKKFTERKTANQKGTVFTAESTITEGENPRILTSITPTSMFDTNPVHNIPCLTKVEWESAGVNSEGIPLSRLKLLNVIHEHKNMANTSLLKQMQGLFMNLKTMHDFRTEFPFGMDNTIEAGLFDRINHFTTPPKLNSPEGGRLTVTSLGGNNMKEIALGFGDRIGGNSKVICHEGLDENGRVDRVGVIVDLGLHLSPKDEPNVSAAPDVIEQLKYCNDILITHRHLDHTDGLLVYVQSGLLKGKTVHATPKVILSILDKLSNFPIDKQKNYPHFSPLEGTGWLHISKDGAPRLSVNYACDATPHSTPCTPFFIHGHYKGNWIGSYLNPGDSRYGYHNSDEYKGQPVEGDYLNKAFFRGSNQRFLDEMKHLAETEQLAPEIAKSFDPNIAKRGPTYFELDLTSIENEDWSATEPEVEESLVKLAYWFKDKGVLMSMISTNDGRFETALRAARRAHRDVTEFGTNLMKTATAHNKLGVNPNICPADPRNNIQGYLDYIFLKELRDKVKHHECDFRVGRLHAALNDDADSKASAAYRQAVMKQLKVVYRGERIADDLLTNKEKLLFFIERNHYGKDDTFKSFLDSVGPGLADGHPLKTMQSQEIMVCEENASSNEEHAIINKIERNEARQDAFEILAKQSNAFIRYKLRKELEKKLGEEYDRATLGSLGGQVGLERDDKLGSLRVTRISKTAKAIMSMGGDPLNPPGLDGNRFALLTGTQGTNVEDDSSLSALAKGRHPVLDGNPKYKETARPIVPENNVVIISQTAITGNQEKQDALVKDLRARHFTVVQATRDGFKIYFSDKDKDKDGRRDVIINDLMEKPEKEYEKKPLKKGYEFDKDGALVVHGMPIHASGHGNRKDCEAWLDLVRADKTAGQHTSSLAAGHELEKLCNKTHCPYMGRIVPNFEGLSIRVGKDPESIGRLLASFILVETKRKTGDYHGGYMDARRIVRQDVEEGISSDGLRARLQKGGWYETAFARVPLEIEGRTKRAPLREPVIQNRQPPVERQRFSGAINPASLWNDPNFWRGRISMADYQEEIDRTT